MTEYARLSREPEGRILAGVCTGLSRYTGIDAVVYRVAFAILVLGNGQGILLYIAAALLMPAGPDVSSVVEQLLRRRFDAPSLLTMLGALLAAAFLLNVAGAMFSPGSVAVLVVVALIMLSARSRGVDLIATARGLPHAFQGHPVPKSVPAQAPTTASVPPRSGMIDLAPYSEGRMPAGRPRGLPLDDLDDDGAEGTAPEPRQGTALKGSEKKKGWSPFTHVTVIAAIGAGAIAFPLADAHPPARLWTIVLAVSLGVVGVGLLFGGWIATRGLVGVGVSLTIALLISTVVMTMPKGTRFGEVEWRPVNTMTTHEEYRLAVGRGQLDLTELEIDAGQRISVLASVKLGALKLRVPKNVRINLTARLTIGDLTVDTRTLNGPQVQHRQVLEAEGVPNPAVIDLNVRSRIGDVEVTRV